MAIQLNKNISRVRPSATLALAARVGELKAEGKDVIGFTAGEPDFSPPEYITQAVTDAVEQGYTRYTPVGGIPELKQSIIAKLSRDQKVDYTPAEIIVTNGGKQALAAACAVLLEPGDEVIVPAPYWTSYPDMVRLAGGEPVIVKTDPTQGYLMSPEQLQQAITPRTRALFINSPSNPSGAAYPAEALKALAQVIQDSTVAKNILVISDEIYEYITYDGFEHLSIATLAPELKEQTLIVNGFSKSHAITGWRIGYAAGPKELIGAMTRHQGQFTSNVCSIVQRAVVPAYDDDGKFPKMMAEEFSKRLELVVGMIEATPGLSLPVKPAGAFYAFIRIEDLLGKTFEDKSIGSGDDFCSFLLDEYGVVVVPGSAFGDVNAFRLSFAVSPEVLKRGLDKIAEAVGQFN